MKPTVSTVYHVVAFSWYAFVVRSLAGKDGEDLPPGIFVYGGPWKYLTFLNLASTVVLSVVLCVHLYSESWNYMDGWIVHFFFLF